jgi:predicted metal-dependent TIM-barrel fold hydrolase
MMQAIAKKDGFDWCELEKLAENSKVVAIGEIRFRLLLEQRE